MTYYVKGQKELPENVERRRKVILTEIGGLARERLRLQKELALAEERFAGLKAELFALRADGGDGE